MKIDWVIDEADLAVVREFFDRHRDDPLVRKRVERNLRADKPVVTRDEFWDHMVGCLLTTQQRSGPHSHVSRFLTRPLPLGYETCLVQTDLAGFARSVLSGFGGLRRTNIVSNELVTNLAIVEGGGWGPTLGLLEEVRTNSSPETERRAADFIDEKLKGFGPKQSRNLLQWIGLSRYEVPLDSRITKWLNEIGFPVKVSADLLGNLHYYQLVSIGFQKLSEACGIVPCVLDAAIFASYDEGGWTDDNVVW